MAGYARCIENLARAAGRALTEDEIHAIYERVHKAALDIKAGRIAPGAVGLAGRLGEKLGTPEALTEELVVAAARKAAADLATEADAAKRQAYLQIIQLGARHADIQRLRAEGFKPLEAVDLLIARDYSGRTSVESIEQRVMGYQSYFLRKLLDTWEALGNDFLGFFQDRAKALDLMREIHGQPSGNALAARAAQIWHQVAEEMRQVFNAAGAQVAKLQDWGAPRHHSQERVARAGQTQWVDDVMPYLNRTRYVDELTGTPWSDAEMREFLMRVWETIATDGKNKLIPGQFRGVGKRANRHAEHRELHFKDAESEIAYWEAYGERTLIEILTGHVKSMARDIAFVEYFGPNPELTFRTLRDDAVRESAMALVRSGRAKDRVAAGEQLDAQVRALNNLWDYSAQGRGPALRPWLRKTADAIAHANVFGKLGSAAITSFFGDKTMLEAVSHLNNLPIYRRWVTELSATDPTNPGDRRALQRHGLMLDSVRSGLQRFGDELGGSTLSGRIANAVMRITGMQLINDARKGGFGLMIYSAIGNELRAGKAFGDLAASDVRLLRNYGISEMEWKTWQLAKLDSQDLRYTRVENLLTPDAIAGIPDDALRGAGIIGAADGAIEAEAARRNAIVKLLGAVNTESEFAIVTPGWRERALMLGMVKKAGEGTVPGEIWRSVLQFKSFPWSFFQRGMDLVANQDTGTSKALAIAWLVASTSLAGAMIMQTKEVLSGKDPRKMFNEDWYKFWGAAFIYGGALGFYGDFLYSANQTRYGSGPIEALSGPTLGPLLELSLVQPLGAARRWIEGQDTQLMAQTITDLRGFVPMNNAWFAKAALDHLVWQQVLEALNPGYLASIRRRTLREYGQDRWWDLGETSPRRWPDFEEALAR